MLLKGSGRRIHKQDKMDHLIGASLLVIWFNVATKRARAAPCSEKIHNDLNESTQSYVI